MKLGDHSELSSDLGMEESESSGGFTFIYFHNFAYMLLHAHSGSDHSLTAVRCVCGLGPQVSPLHAVGLTSRVTAKRSQN